MNKPDNHMQTPSAYDLSRIAFRVGFLSMALILFSFAFALQGGSRALLHPENILWSLGFSVCGFVFALIALLPNAPLRLNILILAATLMYLCVSAAMQSQNFVPIFTSRTDNEMIAEYSVEAIRRGENPYQWDFTDMTRVFRDRGAWTTQFLDNTTQFRVTYPVLPSVILYVFDLLGLGEVRVVSFIAQIALVIALFFGAPTAIRPLVLLPLFILSNFFYLSINGAQDTVWSLLLVGMMLTWKRPILRAVLFGLAVTFRQQPWFIAPFLLMWMAWQPTSLKARLRAMALFIGISAGVFLVFNLPYIIWDARAWLLGAIEPSYAAFNIYSQGLSVLTQYGILNVTRAAYTTLQIAFYVGALIIYWRHGRRLGMSFWLVPAFFFWLYYRGLANYWFYWVPPMLLVVARAWSPLPNSVIEATPAAVNTAMTRVLHKGTAVRRRWVTAGFITPLLLLSIGITGYSALQPASAMLEQIAPPRFAGFRGEQVNEITIRVTNTAAHVLRPRFSVQLDRVAQIYPWRIVSGAETLAPNESAIYVITADGNPLRMFNETRGAQIVMTDASGDYALRAMLDASLPTRLPTSLP